MVKSIARVFLRFIFVLFSVITLIFFTQRLIPGTPADAVFGPDAPLLQKEAWLRERGLDRPIFQQYKDYISKALKLDFGRALIDDKPLTPQIATRLVSTLRLACSAFLVSLFFAFLSGILGAFYVEKGIDKVLSVLSLVLVSAPVFVTGTFLLWFFSVRWNLLPLTGDAGWRAFILPSLSLGGALAAMTSRLIRASLLEVLNEDYIRTARAKGVTLTHVYLKHALRNALLPVITVLGLQLAALLGGTVITEHVFTWPGLGTLIIEAVHQRDYNLVSACVVVLALTHMTIAIVVDVLQKIVDPRTEKVFGR